MSNEAKISKVMEISPQRHHLDNERCQHWSERKEENVGKSEGIRMEGERKGERKGRRNAGFLALLPLLFPTKHSCVALPVIGRLGNGNLLAGPLQNPTHKVILLTNG